MTAAVACAECGTPFSARNCRHRFCSLECQSKACLQRRRNKRVAPEPLTTRRCALDSCGTEFQPTRAFQRFCSHRCGVTSYNRIPESERKVRRLTKVERHPNTLLFAEMRADVGPGKCIYCEKRVRSVKAYICGGAECLTDYRRDYGTMRRKREKEARPTPAERACKCGCGAMFVPPNGWQLYVSETHTRKRSREYWREERRRQRAGKAKKPRGPSILFGQGRALPGGTYAAG